jgi:hypothetical protein
MKQVARIVWMRYIPPKPLLNFNGLYGVIYHKIDLFSFKDVRKKDKIIPNIMTGRIFRTFY